MKILCRVLSFTFTFCLTVALFASPPIADDPEQDEPDRGSATVRGEVLVNDYDDDGNVASVWIQDDELGDVLIDPSGVGNELTEYVGHEVEATGRLLPADDAPGFDHVLHVERYTVDSGDRYDDDQG
jgi:hypothetical protein